MGLGSANEFNPVPNTPGAGRVVPLSAESSVVLDRTVRKYVFEHFLEHGAPPVAEEIAPHLRISRSEAEASLDRLDAAHHLKLVPGTHRILMAFPFSALATPYRVELPDGRRYFANCAWDALAFHVMTALPLHVESFCHHCLSPIRFDLADGEIRPPSREPPVVYLGLPASEWWNDIVRTCGTAMVFFSSSRHLRDWRSEHPEESGEEVSLRQILKLSEPIYRTKLELSYARPSTEELRALFLSLGLTGPFWQL